MTDEEREERLREYARAADESTTLYSAMLNARDALNAARRDHAAALRASKAADARASQLRRALKADGIAPNP